MRFKLLLIFWLLILAGSRGERLSSRNREADDCYWKDYVFESKNKALNESICPLSIGKLKNTIYLLYDINPPEGFNLRRDVYIRLAVFVRNIKKKKFFANLRLVLPPWRRLYHWRSQHIEQDNVPWKEFFDLPSLKRFAPVLDFPEFMEEIKMFGLKELPYVNVNHILQMLHFEEMFESGVFHDKYYIDDYCPKLKYLRGYLLGESKLLDNELYCLRFQGSANLLQDVLSSMMKYYPSRNDVKVIALLNAEVVLHDHWGDSSFWKARRSMRFADKLIQTADLFRLQHFNSTNEKELVQRPVMWEYEKPYRKAIGGPYLCAHLRRGDFIHGREKSTPTLKSAAFQIKEVLQHLNLTTVFLATDATAFELMNLKSYMQRAKVVRFTTESLSQKRFLKDGGIAIVDQIICSHARHFIGTYESTFTYRIYEEREILGFPKASTFNTFCKNASLNNCSKNSIWPITY